MANKDARALIICSLSARDAGENLRRWCCTGGCRGRSKTRVRLQFVISLTRITPKIAAGASPLREWRRLGIRCLSISTTEIARARTCFRLIHQ